MSLRIGVDLGGTKIEIAALDAVGEVVARKRVDTPAGDYSTTLKAIVSTIPVWPLSSRIDRPSATFHKRIV